MVGGTRRQSRWPAAGAGALVATAAVLCGARAATDDLPRLAHPRALFTATPLAADRILIAGGTASADVFGAALGDAEILSFGPDGATLSPPIELAGILLKKRVLHSAAPLAGGRVLLAGGSATGLDRFDPAQGKNGAFVRAGALPGGMRVALEATALADGRVLVTGGRTAAHQDVRTTELVAAAGDAVAAGPPLLEPRSSHTATLLADGRVLVVGGPKRATTELYDPVKDAFAAGPALRHARDDHRATRLQDGRVLIAGGQDATGRSVATAELFDPATGEIAPVGDLHDARSDHAQVLLPDGTVLVLGGETDDGADHDTILASVERFDPRTLQFRRCEPLRAARDDHQAVVLSDGRVVAIGGFGPGDAPRDTIEILSP